MARKLLFTFLALCCYVKISWGVADVKIDLIESILDIVGRIEGVTKLTVEMANTIKTIENYSDEKWVYDFFNIQLKTAAIYKKVIEHSRRNSEILKIKAAIHDFQKSSIVNSETKLIDRLKKLVEASIKTKILADKLYDIMEPYKYVITFPEDHEQLKEVHRKLELTLKNVYFVLDTTFEFLNYVDKKTLCFYISKIAQRDCSVSRGRYNITINNLLCLYVKYDLKTEYE